LILQFGGQGDRHSINGSGHVTRISEYSGALQGTGYRRREVCCRDQFL
jgi:hypothetical protein